MRLSVKTIKFEQKKKKKKKNAAEKNYKNSRMKKYGKFTNYPLCLIH